MGRRACCFWLWAWMMVGCSNPSPPPPELPSGDAAPKAPSPSELCPATAVADEIPGTQPEHLKLSYWLETLADQTDLDAPLLTPAEVALHNAATELPKLGRNDLLAPVDEAGLQTLLKERLAFVQDAFMKGVYVGPKGESLASEAPKMAAPTPWPALVGELRVALGPVPMRCSPRIEGNFKAPVDTRFDRNNCSTARPQEPMQVLARWPTGMWLARTSYAMGWIKEDSPLSAPLSKPEAEAVVRATRHRTTQAAQLQTEGGGAVSVGAGVWLPEAGGGELWVADAQGLRRTTGAAQVPTQPEGRVMTRRALLTEGFGHLGKAYGWGDEGGGLDCSRFLQDSLGAFGLKIPRASVDQAQAGSYALEVSEASEAEKLQILDEVNHTGVAMLHFPGHIMMYLGREKTGTPMALHSFAEFVKPCEGATPDKDGKTPETLYQTHGVTVTNLELGRGSSRRSFLERITKIIVFGKNPSEGLLGAAQLRPGLPPEPPGLGEKCEDEPETTIMLSPRVPTTKEPLRVVVTSYKAPTPSALVLWGPKGERVVPTLRRLGGPPWAYVATTPTPLRAGEWVAAFGEGKERRGCHRFKVGETGGFYGRCKMAAEGEEGGDPVWYSSNGWGPRTESLYSAFVESLFDFPLEQDLTWPNLTVLLRDPERNLLYNHFGRGEDERLSAQPDCADLPYFLRTYFAWKMRLPMGIHTCSRGAEGKPPWCDQGASNKVPCQGANDIDAFQLFLRKEIGGGVHSGNGRTAPKDSDTDYYPIPLTREAIRPGTIYADPYGHVMMVVRWVPQRPGKPGVLLAADSQPDGTIGRRRFWRGTFLFTPETQDVGAGFKAFRPVLNRGRDEVMFLGNGPLKETTKFIRYSEQQYEGSADDFYDAMEGLINPRPLDPFATQTSLIDALAESVARRVVSVDNGEAYMKGRPPAVQMPDGYDIFETEGAWEDYATPSRDMRLLIAIDTVAQHPDRVAKRPERYGLAPGIEAESVVERLRTEQARVLRARSFEYTRSDGQPQRLSLWDVVERAKAFEVSYNPNDCPEWRWGAKEGSQEMASCRRRAPKAQQDKMGRYRPWFERRLRPPR